MTGIKLEKKEQKKKIMGGGLKKKIQFIRYDKKGNSIFCSQIKRENEGWNEIMLLPLQKESR